MTKIIQDPVTSGPVRQLTWNVAHNSSFTDKVGVQRNLWNRWICPGFNSMRPRIFTFGRLLNIPFYVMLLLHRDPQKSKPVKQTARSPRGVISAAVDGCSAADTPVNHGRNSLKRPHNIETQAAPAVWQERSLTFCISPRQRQIVEQRPQARTLLSLAQTYDNQEHTHTHARALRCISAAKYSNLLWKVSATPVHLFPYQ